ncbi:aspartyl-phosphate phosphatase Spo0E family protein [Cohnella xylanilytica]|uniref:Aspartyl-phosphate phosphatase Spo0E family protein n=1 Tax=Cohnella xylanilytica TaxID=557555 RepID=A0A841TSU9_9BACL|nr:aspartyl-phosphate phosphatase Spo0E family protein [Cohnella xylanilytica]MBB6690759.1 aspartyl-phosphate phosphatase Spo0E family protein [Cohnella xylanilytica]
MTRLLGQLEEERRKLNELGKKSLEHGIPLYENEAVQAQSRKVDELIVQLHRKRAEREHQLR